MQFILFILIAAILVPETLAQSPNLRFVPVTPCRIKDTRVPDLIITPFSEISGQATRTFEIGGHCGIPATAKAFSLNITAIPLEPLSYLTIWPTGQLQPLTSLLNSWNGHIVAAAAIVQAGTNASVNVYATNPTHLVIDVNGYFTESPSDLAYFPLPPCRVFDSRIQPHQPQLAADETRTIPVTASSCAVPANAQAYSVNVTAVTPPDGTLTYLTAFPAGAQRPFVSTLNALQGGVVANAAIVPAGTGGAISIYLTHAADVIIDINGYFAPDDGSGLSFRALPNCRLMEAGNSLTAGQSLTLQVAPNACGVPLATPAAYVLNATVVPSTLLSYLTLWPTGLPSQPLVSTLNALQGGAVSNMAIVPAGPTGAIHAFVTDPTLLLLDISGYFAR